MKKEHQWNITVDGQTYCLTCILQGNRYVLYCGDDHVANVYHSVGTDSEAPVMVAGKECLFVVWDERPDLVVDGMFLDRKTDYAEALKSRQKAYRLMYRIIFWGGVVVLALTAFDILRSIGKEMDIIDIAADAVVGLLLVLYGHRKTRWLTQPPERSIMSEDKTKGAKEK